MEEEKKEEKFEVAGSEGPVKKKSKKGLLVGFIVILLIAAIAFGVYWFFFRDESKLQLTEKDKVTNSLNKVENKLDEITDGLEVTERKISNNLMERPFKANMTITGQINEFNVQGTDSSEVAQVNALLNGSSIVLNGQGNLKEGKLYGELIANVPMAQLNNQKLAEAVITKDVAAFKSSMEQTTAEPKYYAIFKDSLLNSKYSEYAELFNMFDYVGKSTVKLEDLEFTKDEKQYFKDTYGELFKKYVTNDKISKESAEVNGKKCDKVTYTIDNATMKEIIKDYANTFRNDTKGQDILMARFVDPILATGIAEKTAGMTADQFKAQLKQGVTEALDELINDVDGLSIEKVDFVVYATATETYKIELNITAEGETVTLALELKDKEIDYAMSVRGITMMNGMLKNDNGTMLFTMDIQSMAKLEVSAKEDASGSNITMKVNANIPGSAPVNMEMSLVTVVNEDTETRLNEDITFSIKGSFEGQSIDVAAKVNCVLEIVDSVVIPEVTRTNAIDMVTEGYLDQMLGGGTAKSSSYTTPVTTTVPTTTTTTVPTTTTTTTTSTTQTKSLYEIQTRAQEIQSEALSIQSQLQNGTISATEAQTRLQALQTEAQELQNQMSAYGY